MDNIKNDSYFLNKILEDLKFVIDNTKERSEEEIKSNQILIDCILFRIIQVSENSSRLTDDFKQKYNKIPWRAIKGMRNTIVHDYGVVDYSIIYETVSNSIPYMYNSLVEIKEVLWNGKISCFMRFRWYFIN